MGADNHQRRRRTANVQPAGLDSYDGYKSGHVQFGRDHAAAHTGFTSNDKYREDT